MSKLLTKFLSKSAADLPSTNVTLNWDGQPIEVTVKAMSRGDRQAYIKFCESADDTSLRNAKMVQLCTYDAETGTRPFSDDHLPQIADRYFDFVSVVEAASALCVGEKPRGGKAG
jgi:hypothetical protein